jgi:hypothetical protein
MSARSEVMQAFLPAIRAYAAEVRQRKRARYLWSEADTYARLCELMAQFVQGELPLSPGHMGPTNPETNEIAYALAHANRQGFLTISSQPGCIEPLVNDDGSPAECGADYRQRASVEGHANSEMHERLTRLVSGTRLKMVTHSTYRWGPRADYTDAFVVSMIGDQEVTHFGARLSQRELSLIWSGIQGHLFEQIVPLHQVTITDPEWGPQRLLWDRLEQL